MKKQTLDEYLKALEKMKQSPSDRLGILGELGVTGLGLTTGFALSGTIAGAAGVATFAGSTTLASVLGGLFVTTTPVGWVIGAALVGGSVAYGVGKLVRSGGKCDMLRNLSMREIEQRIRILRQEAQCSSTHDERMPKIISGIQYLVANLHITQKKATELLAAIEKGHISVDDAFQLIQGFINQGSS